MTYQTTLYQDGRIERSPIDAPATAPSELLGQLTPQQMTQFEQQLRQLRLGNISGLRYRSTTPAADFRTVTLAHGGHAVQYEDVTIEQLPTDLQKIITLWQRISISNE